MGALFEELDFRPTEIGALSLRRRRDLRLDLDVLEIMLGDEFLMSSAFTTSEVALAQLGLDATPASSAEVVVGGLGLGYTARAALDHPKTASMIVVEFLTPIIEWHRNGLLPLGRGLCGDDRCRFVQGDFFAMAVSEAGFDPNAPGRRFDAILVDIDHTPDAPLDDRSKSFYGRDGLRALSRHLKPGAIFGLWSNEGPDERFVDTLGAIFARAWAEPITFHNPLQDKIFTQTVYLARTAQGGGA
ncbi:spermidine synthase [Faunimonas sp. B44]|uniref:spermidine synthase n=1 Tax=Faunimonas sp. B44 TaxID=3461493 RepID=UPI0040449FF2